jgi:DNA-directed RNA polymerase subunit N (RpoN/RPB10)
LNDDDLARKYEEYRKKLRDSVVETDKKIQDLGWQKFLETK